MEQKFFFLERGAHRFRNVHDVMVEVQHPATETTPFLHHVLERQAEVQKFLCKFSFQDSSFLFFVFIVIFKRFHCHQKIHITNQLKRVHIPDEKIKFIDAIYEPTFGALGCTKSHIVCLQHAIHHQLKSVVILEDDFTIRHLPSWYQAWDFFNKHQNLKYDVIQDYLPCMFFMMKELETQGYRINSVCPLRTDIIPKHVRIDTTSFVHICLTERQGTKEEFLTKGNLVRNQSKIWGFFFKTNKKCFHMSDTHKYTFDHMISTDGVSCSVLSIKKELQGRSIFRFKPKKTPSTEKYIDELEEHEYIRLQEKKVVGWIRDWMIFSRPGKNLKKILNQFYLWFTWR